MEQKDLDSGYEIRCYRVVWYFELGTWGDSEGRTWRKTLKYKKGFPTQEEAHAAREAHPWTYLDKWGGWRTTYDYGKVAIVRREELLSTSVTTSSSRPAQS